MRVPKLHYEQIFRKTQKLYRGFSGADRYLFVIGLVGFKLPIDHRRLFDVPAPGDLRDNSMVDSRAKSALPLHDLGPTVDPDAARSPGVDGLQVINDQGDLGIASE